MRKKEIIDCLNNAIKATGKVLNNNDIDEMSNSIYEALALKWKFKKLPVKLENPFYMVEYNDNWADEIDISQTSFFTEHELKLNMLIGELLFCGTVGVGSNEFIEYDSFEDMMNAVSITPLKTDEEALKHISKQNFDLLLNGTVDFLGECSCFGGGALFELTDVLEEKGFSKKEALKKIEKAIQDYNLEYYLSSENTKNISSELIELFLK